MAFTTGRGAHQYNGFFGCCGVRHDKKALMSVGLTFAKNEIKKRISLI